MLLRWTPDALHGLLSQIKYIQQENPALAFRVAEAVEHRMEQLSRFPNIGRLGTRSGTRELVVTPFVVVYRIRPEVVEFLHLYHGAQAWQQ